MMLKPFPFFRAAAPLALAIAACATLPQAASAQMWGARDGWRWGPPPARMDGPPPAVYGDDTVSLRAVARILNARGYRLISAPTYSGDRLFATGENPAGGRARFVLDAYDGTLLRVVRAEASDPVLRPPGYIPHPPADYAYGGPEEYEPVAPLAPAPHRLRPKHKLKPKAHTASRMVEPKPAPIVRPAPSEATKAPAEPAPAPKPGPAQAVAAPSPSPQTPLAPDAAPTEGSTKGPIDIGPKVEPVARAREAAPPVAAPAAPVATKPADPVPASPNPAPAADAGEPGPDMSK